MTVCLLTLRHYFSVLSHVHYYSYRTECVLRLVTNGKFLQFGDKILEHMRLFSDPEKLITMQVRGTPLLFISITIIIIIIAIIVTVVTIVYQYYCHYHYDCFSSCGRPEPRSG